MATLVALAVLGCGGGGTGEAPSSTLRVGVMLPLSGAGDVGWREPLELAVANVNLAGGPAGRRIELVYQDIATVGVVPAARAFIADASILAVIGPDTSAGMMEVAPLFLAARKPLLSPSATSGEVFRAFGGKSYVWRTVQSDVAQVKALLLVAAKSGAKTVALVSGTDAYGVTFFDWMGFLATEIGIQVTNLVRYDQSVDCAASVDAALTPRPDVLVVVPSLRPAATCIARRARAVSPDTRLLFSDGGLFPGFVADLGALAQGIEGVAPGPDPTLGFAAAYQGLFGHAPPAYAANVYDGVLLIAYGLDRSGGSGGAALAAALEEVVDGRGATTAWTRDGIAAAFAALRRGERPDVGGATGPLHFDQDLYMDPVATTYAHWRVDQGQYVTVDSVRTGSADGESSLDRSFASQQLLQDVSGGGTYRPGPRTGSWAFIVALSRGWQNYRHQADALAQYQLLRANGIPDDHIVLVLADDIAGNSQNSEPGVVRNVAGGPNLRAGAVVDYSIGDLGASDLLAILQGRRSARLPEVIDSGPGDDVYVFFVGHGDGSGVFVGASGATGGLAPGEGILGPVQFTAAVQAMFDQGRYRRLFVTVETCHGGVMGSLLTAPGALLLAGANPVESSFGTNFDPSLGAWLGDEFAYAFVTTAASTPKLGLDELYRSLFHRVGGSHVSLYNNQGFGGAGLATLEEFVKP